jgi:hypothetical protein
MMKYTLKMTLVCFTWLMVYQTSQAQIKDVGTMISGSTQDAEKLFSAYLKPFSKAFGADLNGGWYNTAKTHKLGGFDLTFSVSAAIVPSADKTFNVKDLNLQGNPVITGNSAPTVAGARSTGPQLEYQKLVGSTNYTYAKFNTPKGTGVGIIPAPMLQLGIGLIKETDVTIRYVPNLNVGDFGGLGMWGIGLKHSIKQWIPGIKHAPFFHLSFFGGYTQLKTKANLSLSPDFYVTNLGATKGTLIKDYSGQQMQMNINGFTANILASFDLPVVTFYGGVGFSSTSSTLKLKGTYPLASVNSNGQLVVEDSNAISDPISLSMKSSDGSTTKPRLNAGIKFKFAIITLHFDYTYANYSVATAGLGISFR